MLKVRNIQARWECGDLDAHKDYVSKAKRVVDTTQQQRVQQRGTLAHDHTLWSRGAH
jgi:hypothetical protein